MWWRGQLTHVRHTSPTAAMCDCGCAAIHVQCHFRPRNPTKPIPNRDIAACTAQIERPPDAHCMHREILEQLCAVLRATGPHCRAAAAAAAAAGSCRAGRRRSNRSAPGSTSTGSSSGSGGPGAAALWTLWLTGLWQQPGQQWQRPWQPACQVLEGQRFAAGRAAVRRAAARLSSLYSAPDGLGSPCAP